MSKPKIEIVVVCEDDQHEAFVRRFLKQRGYPKRKIRVKKSPSGHGSAEQWVRKEYIEAVKIYRSRHVEHKVLVMVDGDRNTVKQRLEQFDQACEEGDCEPRGKDERIAIFVPCRNIATWIAYLNGAEVDEQQEYPRLDRERECKAAIIALIDMCDRKQLRPPAPPSLQAACEEYDARLH